MSQDLIVLPRRISRATHALLLAVALLECSICAAWPGREWTEAYWRRGRLVELDQQAYHRRLECFHADLTAKLLAIAPDLLKSPAADPPPPVEFGYQIVGTIIPSEQKTQRPVPAVESYSWPWTDQLIAAQVANLRQLSTRLAQIEGPASHTELAGLLAEYAKAVRERRHIETHVQHNWLWQEQIAHQRPLFERLQERMTLAIERQRLECSPGTRGAEASQPVGVRTGSGSDPGEGHRERSRVIATRLAAGAQNLDIPVALLRICGTQPPRIICVKVYTDISDDAFVLSARTALEKCWQVRLPGHECGLRVELVRFGATQLYPATRRLAGQLRSSPPLRGNRFDMRAHLARFPKDGAVITSGGDAISVAGRAIIVGPHDVPEVQLAHEFGHVLGFPDEYFRGFKDLGPDGFLVMEFSDSTDIMADSRNGIALPRHFEVLLSRIEMEQSMLAGLDSLYSKHNAALAVSQFRRVLTLNPMHYGATVQLAKALDQSGQPEAAVELWKEIRTRAEGYGDTETAKMAHERLGLH